jgi:Chromatin assembly factor 1 subunit A
LLTFQKKKKKSQKQIDKELEAERKSKSQLKLSSFFKKVDKPKPLPTPTIGSEKFFRPFTIKPNVIMAPYNRFWRQIDIDKFFSSLEITTPSIPLTFKPRPPLIPPKSITPLGKPHSFKFLKFAEDVRPPYYGTFFKSSTLITPHNPLATDPQLDYDFDSEGEWDDEPGEDLVSEVEEDDTVPNDDDDPTRSSWLVPHGYLSDDEGESKPGEVKVKIVTVLVPVIISGGMEVMPELVVVKLMGGKVRFDFVGCMDPFEVQASTFQEYKPPGDNRNKKSSVFPTELVPELEGLIRECEGDHTLGILINNFWILHQDLTKTAIETEFKKLARKAKTADGVTKYMLRAEIEELKSRQSLREGGGSIDYFERYSLNP